MDDYKEDPPHEETSHSSEALPYIIMLLVLISYLTIGSWMEIKKFKICHETGVIIVAGIILSLILRTISTKVEEDLKFNNAVFFDILLPLIIFATGYNMRRKNFFENIMNIAKLGIFGTLTTFFAYSALTYSVF